jgi:predicted lysophospholipase L1 biosynthesis ABC-type transport system permease subunit
VQAALASRGVGGTLPATSWWLTTRTGAPPAGLPAGSSVADAAQEAATVLHNPLSAAPVQAAVAVAAAAALLAGLGFCVSVAASARARRSQRALLAALGVPPAAQARLFCLEEGMISVPAAVLGLVFGVALAHVLIPSMTLTPTAGLPVPPVLVKLPLAWVASVAVAVPAIPVLAAAIATLRQPDPAATLRAAEAAG